jgi:hypothetical protein
MDSLSHGFGMAQGTDLLKRGGIAWLLAVKLASAQKPGVFNNRHSEEERRGICFSAC